MVGSGASMQDPRLPRVNGCEPLGAPVRRSSHADASGLVEERQRRPQPLRLELAPAPDGEAGQRHGAVRGDAGEQDVGLVAAARAAGTHAGRRTRGPRRRARPRPPRPGPCAPSTARRPVNRPRSSAGSARHTVSKSTRLVVGPSKRTCEGSKSPWATPSGPGGVQRRGRRPRRGGGAATRRGRGPSGRGRRRPPAPRRSRRRGCGGRRPGSTTGAGRRRSGRTRRPPPRR